MKKGKAIGNDEEEIRWSSDEFEGLEDDDEGEVEREKCFELEKGKVYGNIHMFRAALADYAVYKGIDILRLKNERKRVTAICAATGCPWRVHASLVADGVSFMIKTYNPTHTCKRKPTNKNANSRWIAEKLGPLLKADPQMSD